MNNINLYELADELKKVVWERDELLDIINNLFEICELDTRKEWIAIQTAVRELKDKGVA